MSAGSARLVIDEYERNSLNRRESGVYYTPDWIVEAMLDRLPRDGVFLDPAAGAGAFVVALARRFGASGLGRIYACDIDSRALDAAAEALVAELGSQSRRAVERWRRTNAFKIDFLREEYLGPKPDVIVGNPPYRHDGSPDLPELFPALRGELDLYACFLARSLQLTRNTVALLIPDTWLTNSGSSPVRQMLAEFGLSCLVDFGKPFDGARDTRVHAAVATKRATRCVVESVRESETVALASAKRRNLIDRAETGWFLYRTEPEAAACRVMERAPRLDSVLDVLYGLRTGDNKKHVVNGVGALPLIAGRDFDAYDRHVAPRHLIHKDAFPLATQRQLGRWKIGIQRIRTNSTDPSRHWVEAALLRPNEVGLDSLTLVADRAKGGKPSESLLHVLGVLNSSILNRWYRLSFTDVNVKPVYISALPMPPMDKRVVQLVQRRLKDFAESVEREIDELVAAAYGLSDPQVKSLQVSGRT